MTQHRAICWHSFSISFWAVTAFVLAITSANVADAKDRRVFGKAPIPKQAPAPAQSAAPPRQLAYSPTNELERNFLKATALLYAQTEDGGLKMMCTATAFEHKGNKTRFVTAAHCVANDNETREKVVVEKTNWFITRDELHNKKFLEAEVIFAGYQHNGHDFAVLEVEMSDEIPLMSLAEHDPILGENISNFASPLGLGLQLFRGHVSLETLDRPLIADDINWKGATLLQMSAGPGSSGSSIVSLEQKGIVAFLVGVVQFRGSPNIVAIPVSKFRKAWTEAQAGNYKWYKQADTDGSSGEKGKGVKALWKRIHIDGIQFKPDMDDGAAPNATTDQQNRN